MLILTKTEKYEKVLQPFKILVQTNRYFIEFLILWFVCFISLNMPRFITVEALNDKHEFHEIAVLFPFIFSQSKIMNYCTILNTITCAWVGILFAVQKISYEYNAIYSCLDQMSIVIQWWFEPFDIFKKDIHAIGRFTVAHFMAKKKDSSYYEFEIERIYNMFFIICCVSTISGIFTFLMEQDSINDIWQGKIMRLIMMLLWKSISAITCYSYKKRFCQQRRQLV